MKNTGIQLNADYSPEIRVRRDPQGKIASGLTIGDVTHQNQAIILFARKGEIKEHPLVGASLGDACADEGFDLWRREVAEQIEADGQRIETLAFDERGFTLKAKYR
jgi:hypothetical protein